MTAPTTGIAGGRPNLSGVNPVIPGKRPNSQRVLAWFNTAAFVTPSPYTFGNVGRTFTGIRGPGDANLDTSLIKDTHFEKVDAEAAR